MANIPLTFTRAELDELQARIDQLRHASEDFLILAVGVRGPSYDNDGSALVTLRMGDDEATSAAVHLHDAIHLARGKILDERKAREVAREKAKAEKLAAQVSA